MNKQAGFTLVEIAIVLVIIGLLLGGVLKGQELINQAKIKNLANDFNGLSAAVYGYQDRFKKLPGDDNAASSRWSGSADGNGNGVLEGCYNGDSSCTAGVSSGGVTSESLRFWQHLRLAGFVGGASVSGTLTATVLPQNALGGYLGVQTGAFGNAPLNICSANVPGKLASALDSSMDDGNSKTGQIRSGVITTLNSPVSSATVDTNGGYVADDSTLYVVCKTL